MSHTPGPFRWDGDGTLRGQFGQAICRTPDYDRSEGATDLVERGDNERLINYALNSHTALVAALEQIGYGVLGRADMSWQDAANEMERLARAALKLAKGE